MLETRQEYVATEGNWSVAMAGLKTAKGSVRLSVSMAASMESVLVPTNASVFLDTLERHVTKI